jgi:transcriptional regulator with GAF, ATPase, and Fis domain
VKNLIESELFGHEKGAFTGADTRRLGRLEMCNGGTVFLDEIGELPLRLQAKLLDFIQYKKISPVGSNREIELNVRIIAATNRNLGNFSKDRRVRADLYHRLNVFNIRLPDLSLNSRAIIMLAKESLQKKAENMENKS